MGLDLKHEVYGLFAACIPQEGSERFDGLPLRKRQGQVPDFLCFQQWDGSGIDRPMLLELKTLHYGTSTYPACQERCAAVKRRANALPGEYLGKAQRVDRCFCGVVAGDAGPVEQRLRTYDPVRGLVFGSWGEASPDVTQLLGHIAAKGVLRHRRTMRARNEDEAKSALVWLLRRRWAMTAVRENVRLLLARLQYVGRGTGDALLRRSRASEDTAARARRAACTDNRGHWH